MKDLTLGFLEGNEQMKDLTLGFRTLGFRKATDGRQMSK